MMSAAVTERHVIPMDISTRTEWLWRGSQWAELVSHPIRERLSVAGGIDTRVSQYIWIGFAPARSVGVLRMTESFLHVVLSLEVSRLCLLFGCSPCVCELAPGVYSLLCIVCWSR